MTAATPVSAELRLRAGETIGAAIARSFDELLGPAVAALVSEDPVDDEEIHVARVAIKKTRALLQLLRTVLGEPAFKREDILLKRAAEKLSSLRDAAIALPTLKRAAKGAGETLRRKLAAIEERLAQERRHAPPEERREMARAAAAILEGCRVRLGRLSIAAADWPEIAGEFERSYRRCRRRMRRALRRADDDDFHRWRIALKHHYYQLQLLQPISPDEMARRLRTIEKLQGTIGDDHDLTNLKRSVHDDAEMADVIGHFEKRSRKLRRQCERLAADVLATAPQRLSEHLGGRRSGERRSGGRGHRSSTSISTCRRS